MKAFLSAVLFLCAATAFAAPTISSISPATLPTSGGSIVINGNGFAIPPIVNVGASLCVVSTASATQIVCAVPAGHGTNLPVVVKSGLFGGTASNSVPFSYAPPSISSVTPNHGATAGGYPVTISGSSFGSVPVSGYVTIGPAQCAVTSWSHSTIVCTAPAGRGPNQAVVVVDQDKQRTSPADFDYDPPVITSITPASGPSAGGIAVQIRGLNFSTGGDVTVGGRTCPSTAWSNIAVTCTLPAGEGTNQPVVVSVDGQSAPGVNFSYMAPEITSFNPASLPTAGGGPLQINGVNFGLTPTVTVADKPCPVQTSTHTQILCTAPAGEGTASVVLNSGGQTSNTARIAFQRPELTSITPLSGPQTGGTTLQVFGTNLGITPSVTVGTLPCPVISRALNEIRCTVPPSDTPGQQRVVVTAGGQASGYQLFDYIASPSIAGASPFSLPTAGGISLTISGSNFGSSFGTVMIGSAICIPSTWTNTAIVCTAPAGEGSPMLSVKTSDDRTSNTIRLSYVAPMITSINPASGPAAGGTTIEVMGTNFGLNAVVTVGGQPCVPVMPQSHQRYVCTVPAGAAGPAPVMLSVGGQSSAPIPYTYQ